MIHLYILIARIWFKCFNLRLREGYGGSRRVELIKYTKYSEYTINDILRTSAVLYLS